MSSENKVAVLDPVTLADQIRDRVRQQIVSVIPDEQINGLIKKEWDIYFSNKTTTYRSYGSTVTEDDKISRSDFERAIKAEMEKYIREKIGTAVAEHMKAFTEGTWTSMGKETVKRFVEDYAPYAMKAIVHDIAEKSLQQAAQNLPRY